MTTSFSAFSRRRVLSLPLLAAAAGTGLGLRPAWASTPKVIASFSILADLTRQIAGEAFTVEALVPAGADAHVWQPAPQDAARLAGADLVIVNGLGFEGWLDRLVASAAPKGQVTTASRLITPLAIGGEEDDDHDHAHGEKGDHDHDHDHEQKAEHDHDHDQAEKAGHDHDHDHAEKAGHGDDHAHGPQDPHAWQDPANGALYAQAIAEDLIALQPSARDGIIQRRDRLVADLTGMKARHRVAFAALPDDRRHIVTSHDAFGYLAAAYALKVDAVEGLSSDGEPSARDLAQLIDRLRQAKGVALFLDGIEDPRLLQQIAAETGLTIGGTLYADSLTGPDGPAPTYQALLEHNAKTLLAAMTPA